MENDFHSFSTDHLDSPPNLHRHLNSLSTAIHYPAFAYRSSRTRISYRPNLVRTMIYKKKARPAEVRQLPLPLDPSQGSSEIAGPLHRSTVVNVSAGVGRVVREVVISGTYRKDNVGLRLAYEQLLDLGCKILSPTNVRVVKEEEGFVFMEGEQTELPENVEMRHLNAIQAAQFVWLHAPEGYVGPSAALEVGFAHAIGIPVYATQGLADPIVASFVQRVDSPRQVIQGPNAGTLSIPNPAVRAFQNYYRRAAVQRGYAKESARDTLLLMVEEVGELARAIRKKEKLKRHGEAILEDEALELADVFIYVVHLANVLGVDLSQVVKQKELLNIQKLLRYSAANDF